MLLEMTWLTWPKKICTSKKFLPAAGKERPLVIAQNNVNCKILMALSMKNLATPLLPLFHWHRYIEQIEAIGKFFFLIFPFILGKSLWSGENPSGKSLSFCASIFTPVIATNQ